MQTAGSLTGFKHSAATRKLMSQSHRELDWSGDKNPRYGVKVSEETRVKLIEAAKGRAKNLKC